MTASIDWDDLHPEALKQRTNGLPGSQPAGTTPDTENGHPMADTQAPAPMSGVRPPRPPRVRIEHDHDAPGTRVLIDGTDMSHAVTEVSWARRAGALATATVTFHDVEIFADATGKQATVRMAPGTGTKTLTVPSCPACGGARQVPDWRTHDPVTGKPGVKDCPDCPPEPPGTAGVEYRAVDLAVLDLRPGDKILPRSEKRLDDEALACIRGRFAQELPGHQVLLLEGGLGLAILRQGTGPAEAAGRESAPTEPMP